MADKIYNVLFLCTGNSARSILAEALLNHWGKGKFRAFSAGSQPTGTVNPLAIETLRRNNIPTLITPRSKSWDEFAHPNAPLIDFVFTVCDNAANETCPIWPGTPLTAHWGVADPAALTGDELKKINAFREAYLALENRIKLFIQLPLEKLDKLRIQSEIDSIGKRAE